MMGKTVGQEIAELGEGDFADGELAFFVGENLREVEEANGGSVWVDFKEMPGLGLAVGGWSGGVASLSEGFDEGKHLWDEGHREIDRIAARTLAGEEFVGGAVSLTHAGGVVDDDGSVEADPGGIVTCNCIEDFVVGVEAGKLGEVETLAVPEERGESARFTGPSKVDSVEVHTMLDVSTRNSL